MKMICKLSIFFLVLKLFSSVDNSYGKFSFANQAIYVFGDSHTCPFSNYLNAKIYTGPWTMHRAGRDSLAWLDIENKGVENDDLVILSFGEIDVRCHIGKQRDQYRRDLDEILQKLVANYIAAIREIRKKYKNLNCAILSITPPTEQAFNAGWPYYGSLKDRVAITKKLNALLAHEAIKNDIFFLDVYSLYANSEGYLSVELSDGNVHVGSAYYGPILKKVDSLIKQLENDIAKEDLVYLI